MRFSDARKILFKTDYYLFAIIAVIIGISIIRYRLLNIPLERDEGGFALIGQQILHGIVPFKEAYNLILPGLYGMYSLIMALFGQNIKGIHIGLLFVNSATIVFLFLGFRKIFNSSIGFFAASVYGIMSVSSTVLGFAAHATQFVVFFVSVGIYFLALIYKQKKFSYCFMAGLMFGLSFLMKQSALYFILFGGVVILYVLYEEQAIKNSYLSDLSYYAAGAILPFIITMAIMLAGGVFTKFWFWTFTYASGYVSGISIFGGIQLFVNTFVPIWSEFKLFWLLFLAGIIIIYPSKLSKRQKLFAALFAIFGFLSLSSGFYFRQHYFVLFLPAVGLLGGIALDYLGTFMNRFLKIKYLFMLPFFIFLLGATYAISKNSDYYLTAKPDDVSRKIFGSNPCVESKEIAKYIKDHSLPSDRIAILGSEPQILFYADRHSATGYIYTYGLLQLHEYNIKMQDEMISEIKKSNPKFLILCDIEDSWLPKPGSPMYIFNGFDKYANDNYDLAGVVELNPYSRANYIWDKEAKKIQSMGMARFTNFQTQRILIFRRRN